jgi:Uma2 family endonuclease
MPAMSSSISNLGRRVVPLLVNGDRLLQREFHRRYEAMLSHVNAELIGGIVYLGTRVTLTHGRVTGSLSGVLGNYETVTPGVEGMNRTTTILSEYSEPQPDLNLLLLPDCGGQTSVNEDEYLIGAPELIIEVAHGTEDIDLHGKKDDYRTAGVREYLVFCIEEGELCAFDLPDNRPWTMAEDGVFRSAVFPGLWIDSIAALSADSRRLHQTARKGLRSPEHAAFVKRMKSMLTPKKRRGAR